MRLPLSLLIFLSVTQLGLGEQPVEELIIPRRVPVLGGWNSMSVEAQDVQKVCEFAVEKFNTNSKSKKMFKLLLIKNARSQVTNVINYKVSAVLGRTECLKSENHDLKSCNLEQKQLKCLFEVTFDPRNDQHQLLSQNCSKQKHIFLKF